MRRTRLVALVGVVLLGALAGCTGGPVDEPATPEEPNTESTGTTTPSDAVDGESVTVTVTRVIDGDTMEIEYQNGTEDTIRLLGVDTPETTLSRVSPDEFAGIPDEIYIGGCKTASANRLLLRCHYWLYRAVDIEQVLLMEGWKCLLSEKIFIRLSVGYLYGQFSPGRDRACNRGDGCFSRCESPSCRQNQARLKNDGDQTKCSRCRNELRVDNA